MNKGEFRSGDILVFGVLNEGDSPLVFGVDYEIEYLFEGEWKQATWLLPSVWVDILLGVSPGNSYNQSVELFPVYEGTYRISKEVWDQDIRTGVSEALSAEFQVVEETPEEEIPEIPLLPDWFLHELLQLCVLPTHGGWVNRTWVVSRLMDRFSETELVLGSSEFVTGFGGRESFFVGVRHATAEWVEQWPSHCGFDVEIRIEVHSWALTELKDVWWGEREQEPEPLMQSISIQLEYSSLSQPKTFVLMVDGRSVAEIVLEPSQPPVAPAVIDVGEVRLSGGSTASR
ncbi:MAG: immunoglobulin-like domain-containing protein [Candidatus Geothermarchaeales archaeon]